MSNFVGQVENHLGSLTLGGTNIAQGLGILPSGVGNALDGNTIANWNERGILTSPASSYYANHNEAVWDRQWQSNENALNRAFNSSEAQKQREFEERLSSSAYQRATEDMKKAGLNPYLMYTSAGQMASTPTGSSASYNSSGGSRGSVSGSGNSGLATLVGSALQVIGKLITKV